MSAIQTATNPVTGEDITFAKGVVSKIYFNENKNQRSDWDVYRLVIQLGDTRLSAGSVKEERVGVKDSKGNYHDLEVGDEISCLVEINGDFNNTTPSKITMVKKGEGAPAQTKGGNTPRATPVQRGPNLGMIAGNIRTVAFDFLLSNGGEITDKGVESVMAKVAPIVKQTGEWLKSQRPDLDEYSVGASVGQAAIIAAKMVDNLDNLEETMQWLLGAPLSASERITEELYGESKATTPKAPVKAPTSAKKAPKAAKKAPVKQGELEEPSVDNVADIDDDIPF